VFYEIDLLLRSGATTSSLSKFRLPTPKAEALGSLKNKLLMEEKNYNRNALRAEHEVLRVRLDPL
jgi:hypothetical protein